MNGPLRITTDDVAFSRYPLSHIGLAFNDILPTLMTSGRAVLRNGFSLSNSCPELMRFGVTWFMCLGSVQQLHYAALPCTALKNGFTRSPGACPRRHLCQRPISTGDPASTLFPAA